MIAPKILCAISHGYYKPWIDIAIEGQNKTWLAHDLPEGFEVLHYHGTPMRKMGLLLDRIHERIRWTNRIGGSLLKTFDIFVTFPFLWWQPKVSESRLMKLRHKVIQIYSPDSYLTFRWKSRAMFRFALENFEFDYLFMTTTSSYIRPKVLLNLAKNFPRKHFFGGAKAYAGAEFAAGSNRLISRDLVEFVVNNKVTYLPHIIEDVSLSKSILSTGVALTFLPHLDITSIEVLNSLSDSDLNSHYHLRVKSGTFSARNDVELMKAIERRNLI